MSDHALPEPPALTEKVFAALDDKAQLPLLSLIVLGMLAGVYIGLGGLFATIALAGSDAMPFGFAQVLSGFVFALGLALVLVAGAELFTGNTLMAGPVAARRVAPALALRSLSIVYVANFAGSLLLVLVAFAAGIQDGGEGAVGRAAFEVGETKVGKDFWTTLASGIIANMLVCLAVWLAYAGNTVTEKIAGLVLPVAAFVAAGLEHSVANMYLLPFAYLVQGAASDADQAITLADIARNLTAATIGNIIGGSLVALAYLAVYGGKKG